MSNGGTELILRFTYRFGRPYLIQSRHCNVKLPANIYRRDYTPEGLSNVRPSSECTETSEVEIYYMYFPESFRLTGFI